MQDHPSKHRPPVAEKHTHVAAKAGDAVKRKPFSAFLIESDFKPLVFVGQCVQYFGFGAVAAFFFGAVCVYGYAMFKPLPYAAAAPSGAPIQAVQTPTQTPSQPRTVSLHGFLTTNDKPVSEQFEIGVLASRLGPFKRRDGSFSIQVPESDHYLISVWNAGYQRFQLIELKPDSDGDVHEVPFPSGMAGVESPVNNQRSGSSNSYASVRERRFRTGDSESEDTLSGAFQINPTGKAKAH